MSETNSLPKVDPENPPRIQIYILSRDRPVYFRQALDSALIGSKGLADVIVSDNSENDAIQELVARDFPNIQYVRRKPPLSAIDHFRMVVEESSAEFLVLFHDDDLMMPSYAKTMRAALDNNPILAAVGCNALVLRGNKRTGKSIMGSIDNPLLMCNPKEFLQTYLAFNSNGPPPFSGYMYRRKLIASRYLDGAHGGKHSDVSFLTKLLRRGPILWLPEPLMWYRIHASNDSKHESVGERLNWLRYLVTHDGIDLRSPAVRDFKFGYWLRWWSQRPGVSPLSLPKCWRERVVLKFLLTTGVEFAFTRPILWRKLFKKLFQN